MDKIESALYINFIDTWKKNKELASKDNYNYASNSKVDAYCVLIDQYKLESYRFYKSKLILVGSNIKALYIWRPGLW